MRACTPVIFLLFLYFAANTRPALAVWTDPDESQIQGAIKYGERFKFYDNDRFLREWIVVLRRGADKVSVSTKFNMIALASRDAAKESRKLRPEEIKAILDEVDNKLGFTLILFGSTHEFARNFHAVLHYDDIYVQPVRKHNALATPYGWQPMAPPLLRAFCSYEFPFDKIDPNAEISLIIINPQGGEAELFFDLSKMR